MIPLLKKNFNHIALPALVATLFLAQSHGAGSSAEPVEFSHDEIASSLVLISYQVDGKNKSGNGVIIQMEGNPYLLTNLHIILGAEKIRFTTASGERLTPRRVELSNSRDLVRLSLEDDSQGLPFSSGAKMNTPVAIFTGGNGKEQKVEHGKIIGIGGGKLEVSAKFDDSSNGAPALNAKKEVVGITTYSREFSQHAMKTGTRFEKNTRHFCCRVGKDDWIAVNWKTYNRKYGKEYRKHDVFCTQILGILKDRGNFNASTKRASELATECRTHVRQLQLLSEQRDLTGFLLNEFEEKIELFEYAEGLFLDYVNSKR
ncbi:MAG: hypothetical protein DRP64_14250 [Verrucomicrobia bacterium]|nr:MAG: hypothetical protein DRP64_14250 [Verrucomicrobiota bacterium]